MLIKKLRAGKERGGISQGSEIAAPPSLQLTSICVHTLDLSIVGGQDAVDDTREDLSMQIGVPNVVLREEGGQRRAPKSGSRVDEARARQNKHNTHDTEPDTEQRGGSLGLPRRRVDWLDKVLLECRDLVDKRGDARVDDSVRDRCSLGGEVVEAVGGIRVDVSQEL